MDIKDNFIYDEGSNEWIEIVIDKDPGHYSSTQKSKCDDENESESEWDIENAKKWAIINTREFEKFEQKHPMGCDDCVWGIISMENTYPVYCSCLYGQRHTNERQPFLASLGEKIIQFFRYFWSDKN